MKSTPFSVRAVHWIEYNAGRGNEFAQFHFFVSCNEHHVHRATVFLFDDTQLVHEAFLEDVNGVLNTGEVPSLFNNEELVAVNEALTKPAQVMGPLLSNLSPVTICNRGG